MPRTHRHTTRERYGLSQELAQACAGSGRVRRLKRRRVITRLSINTRKDREQASAKRKSDATAPTADLMSTCSRVLSGALYGTL
jgi:hypothetical protein